MLMPFVALWLPWYGCDVWACRSHFVIATVRVRTVVSVAIALVAGLSDCGNDALAGPQTFFWLIVHFYILFFVLCFYSVCFGIFCVIFALI